MEVSLLMNTLDEADRILTARGQDMPSYLALEAGCKQAPSKQQLSVGMSNLEHG